MNLTNAFPVVISLVALSFFSGCWGGDKKKGGSGQPEQNQGVTQDGRVAPPPVNNSPLKDRQPLVGIRDFREIYFNMLHVTGVQPTAAIKQVYDEVEAQLPAGRDLKAFPASQLGVAKLAGEACNEFFNDLSLRSVIAGFNFNAPADQAFDDSGRKLFVSALTRKLWGSGLKSVPPVAEVDAIVKTLVEQLKAAKANVTTIELSKGICMAVLSASPATTL